MIEAPRLTTISSPPVIDGTLDEGSLAERSAFQRLSAP